MKQDNIPNSAHARVDIYAKITDRIITTLSAGVRPWVRPWNNSPPGARISRPLRHNGEPYSGINVLLLWSEMMARGFGTPTWMTFRQAVALGAHVRKGESGSTVVYADRIRTTETGDNGDTVEREIPFLKAYTVFNLEQIDDLPDHYRTALGNKPIPAGDRIAAAERFFAATGASVRHGGDKAFYAPAADLIQMPAFESFRDIPSFYAVLAHETCHWTAPKHRVDRDLSRYGKDRSERAREELVAELGAAFLCADLGIVPEMQPRPDHACYIASWIQLLSHDRRAIFTAAAQAQKAVAYLHGLQPEPAGRPADGSAGEGDLP